MKIVRDLSVLEVNAKWAISRSIRLIPTASTLGAPYQREERMTFAVISMLNTWANFQRTFFVCCLLGVRSPSNRSIKSNLSGTISSYQDAVGKAVLHYRPSSVPRSNGEWDSRDEPTWHDSNVLLHLSSTFGFTNLTDIQAAFSFGFTAHRNLTVFRNYYAHKNRVTREKAQGVAVQYLIPQRIHPTDALLTSPAGVPSSSLIQIWADELSQTVELLCS